MNVHLQLPLSRIPEKIRHLFDIYTQWVLFSLLMVDGCCSRETAGLNIYNILTDVSSDLSINH